MFKLAIIIPAYKPSFLEKTLESLAGQTCLDFKVYVGDDNSPFDLLTTIEKFRKRLSIHYVKFDINLGAQSLVGQWQRCIELSDEPWVWLFSDDDIVGSTCVSSFYEKMTCDSESQFFKFHTQMIGHDGDRIKLFRDRTNINIDKISSQKYITDRIRNNRFRSYAVEYVFSRELYNKIKFVDFPLAWASDDASWLSYSVGNNGISIINDVVYWRFSNENLSSNYSNPIVLEKKLDASVRYINWLYEYALVNDLILDKRDMLMWLFNQYAAINNSNCREEYKRDLILKLTFNVSPGLFTVVYRKHRCKMVLNQVKKALKRTIGR